MIFIKLWFIGLLSIHNLYNDSMGQGAFFTLSAESLSWRRDTSILVLLI